MNLSRKNLDERIQYLEEERKRLKKKLEREESDYQFEKQQFAIKEKEFYQNKEAIEFQLEKNKVLIDYYTKLKENPSWRKDVDESK